MRMYWMVIVLGFTVVVSTETVRLRQSAEADYARVVASARGEAATRFYGGYVLRYVDVKCERCETGISINSALKGEWIIIGDGVALRRGWTLERVSVDSRLKLVSGK